MIDPSCCSHEPMKLATSMKPGRSTRAGRWGTRKYTVCCYCGWVLVGKRPTLTDITSKVTVMRSTRKADVGRTMIPPGGLGHQVRIPHRTMHLGVTRASGLLALRGEFIA